MRRALALALQRSARGEPAGRRGDPLARGRGARRGLASRRGHRARRGRRAVEARRRRGARRDGGRDPRALQPHRAAPARARRRSSPRASPASSTPSPIPIPNRPAARSACAPPASTSRRACSPTRRPTLLASWLTVQRLGRPHVTVKWAQSLDGRAAASDGTSQWITGPDGARRRAPAPRAGRRDRGRHRHGAGRRPGAHRARRRRIALAHQPVPVVIGERGVPDDAGAAPASAPVPAPPGDDLAAACSRTCAPAACSGCSSRAARPSRARSCASGLADEVLAYVAPVLLGGDRLALRRHRRRDDRRGAAPGSDVGIRRDDLGAAILASLTRRRTARISRARGPRKGDH